ncbi:MAG TPA: response regulator transcription factor [Ignavibacteriaceae bacterium]|nr:response regulator transcription factor [Ignavibacteriaceae bacterium]
MPKIKLLIVDDHLLIRIGVINLLKKNSNISIVGEAESGHEAISMFEKLKPNVVLMDISMPDISGIEATKRIKAKYPLANILILTIFENEDYVFNAIRNGASGVLHKNIGKKELVEAILTVAEGKKYFGQGLTQLLIENLMNKHEEEINPRLKEKTFLTQREIQILCSIAEGLSAESIGERLNISTRTVETHKTNMMQKLNINTTAALALYAFESGYYPEKK